TTDSRHTLLHYPNRIKYLEITHVNQVWVADITYLETEQGFCYLSLITDACSRRIVGYDLSLSLSVEGALRSLKMTIEQAVSPLAGLIHHSDHGVQYTSHAYRDCLANNGIYSSMGAVGNCYENALAERMNGILKLEYGLDGCFVDLDQARQAVREAVWLYSFERPHLALAYQVPAQFHAAQLLADQHLAI
ncbi:MAG: IS3 family transposase, partial [Anaerolineales bacterium]|nr:IS3 family transposase [Anaerolineales bacterium]